MGTPEVNIKTILADWLDAPRRHDLAAVERRMDPEVFWQGVREDFVCHNRDEAMEMLPEKAKSRHFACDLFDMKLLQSNMLCTTCRVRRTGGGSRWWTTLGLRTRS
jgi:hypothetical protein